MPHLAEECWSQMGNTNSIIDEKWPQFEESLLTDEVVTIVVQINGKKRAELIVTTNSQEATVFQNAMCLQNIKKLITNNNLIKKKIFIPNKILNIVI